MRRGNRKQGWCNGAWLAIAIVLVGCSGTGASNPPQTSTPYYTPSPLITPTPEPVDPVPPTPEPTDPVPPTLEPTDSPTPTDQPATPSPSPAITWADIVAWLITLRFEIPADLPIMVDEAGDGVGPDTVTPREISDDLDIARSYAGWVELGPQLVGPDAFFDCDEENVLCPETVRDPREGYHVLAAVQTNGDIQLGLDRAGQIAVAFNRPDVDGAAAGSGGYAGADLVIIADLEAANVFAIEWAGSGFALAETDARAILSGSSILFAIPMSMEAEPRYKVVIFQRIPPTEPGAGSMDGNPSFDMVDSFFDIYADLVPIGP